MGRAKGAIGWARNNPGKVVTGVAIVSVGVLLAKSCKGHSSVHGWGVVLANDTNVL